MSDHPITEDRVLRLFAEKIEPILKELTDIKLEKQKISGKLDAIYGNGTGRKGALERIEEKQKEDYASVRGEIKDTKKLLTEESLKQASFRHEMRGVFDTIQLSEATRLGKDTAKEEAIKEKAKNNNSWRTWVKWSAVTVAGIAWELFKFLHEKGPVK